MARDNSAKAKKQKWADWLNAKLAERGWNAADLVEASGGVLIYGTAYNWTKAIARAEAEICLIVTAALNTAPSAPAVHPSDVFEAASYPLFADSFAGKELRVAGMAAEKPDPGLMTILARTDLTDEIKAVMLKWWSDRLAEDEARRLRDAEAVIEMRRESA